LGVKSGGQAWKIAQRVSGKRSWIFESTTKKEKEKRGKETGISFKNKVERIDVVPVL